MRVLIIFGVSGQIGSGYCIHALKEFDDVRVFGFDLHPNKSLQDEKFLNYSFFKGDATKEQDLIEFRKLIENESPNEIEMLGILNATWAPESQVAFKNKFQTNPMVGLIGPDRNRAILDSLFELSTSDLTKEISLSIGVLHGIVRVFGDMMIEIGDSSLVALTSQYGVKPPNQDLFTNPNKFVMKLPGYSISKSGLEMYMLYLAAVFGNLSRVEESKTIRFNCISPGNIQQQHSLEFVNKYIQSTMIPRMAKTEDLLGAIDLMFSKYSRYITGTTINIDGGWTKK
jgi:NAD(P)-dependent dehydrogenase (short-subunit alcohol dehydrogenase family)